MKPVKDPETLVEIPYDQVPPETLQAIVESFILKEGTNYGAEEVSLTTKVAQVLRQIQKGSVKLTFDAETETCFLITDQELRQAKKKI